MISETGVWSAEEQDAHIFSYNVARYAAKLFKDGIVIYDFGCGAGTYTEYFNDVDLFACGFDGYVGENKLGLIQQDLTQPFQLKLQSNIICLEVWEHIPQEYEDVFIDNLVNNLKGYLILSVATPGQDGLGHVNCQPNNYVIEKLTGRGLKYKDRLTQEIRQQPENYVAYFKDTLMVFKK
jgi:hypothetical protein